MEKIKDKRFVVAVVLATVLVLVLVLWRGASSELVYPMDRLRVFFSRQVGSRIGGLFHAAATAAENERLRREVGRLSVSCGEIGRLETENGRLREALGFVRRAPGGWIAAEVLSAGGGAAGARRIVRLSRGSSAGVVRGAAVVAPGGLVGRVSAVSPNTCEVTLVGDPSVRVACEIESAPGACVPRGILFGGDGETLPLKYLTGAGAVRAEGQKVVTSGLGGVFPRGLVVGFLVGLDESEGTVRPAVDSENLEYLFVRREE